MRETGAEKKFGLLTEFLIGESSSKTYAEVANDLDMTEGAVKVAVHRMRRRFGLLLRAEIARTVSSDEEIEAEIRYLISALGP